MQQENIGSAYADLTGAQGRDIFFRPARYGAEDLQSLRPEVRVKSASGDCVLGRVLNFSLNGIAFSMPSGAAVPEGETIENVEISFHGQGVYTGALSVAGRRSEHGETVLGARFVDDVLDVPRIFRLKRQSDIEERLKKTDRETALALGAAIDPEYKATISDFRMFLGCHRDALDAIEADLRGLHFAERQQAASESLALARPAFARTFEDFRVRLNAQVAGHTGEQRGVYKEYTKSQLHPFFMCAPNYHRAFTKPLGYAGDYILMNYFYDETPQGDSVYARLVHAMQREQPLARAVRLRKDLLGKVIRDTVAAKPGVSPVRVLSLASGPAREIVDFVRDVRVSRPVEFTLVEQDKGALGYVSTEISGHILPRRSPVKLAYYNVSFRQMVQNPQVFDRLEKQDLIYSAGLFDYLPQKLAVLLTSALFSRLSEHGRLFIGNMAAPCDAVWTPEYLLDWFLLFRTPDELRGFAAGLPQGLSVSIDREPTGYNLFLDVRK